MSSHPVSAHTTGLTANEVAERVAAGNVNTLPARSGRTTGEIIRANVFTRINAILGILFIIIVSTGSIINGAFGLLIIANSIIGIIQELRAKKTLDNLAVIGEAHPVVRRAAGTGPRERTEIVLDDIIELHPGDQIIVDGECIEADYLEVDESLLTGEADPIAKLPADAVMSGSFVVSGTGAYRATKVGSDSYAAQLAEQASKFTLVNSQLRNGIDTILKVITWLIIPVGLATIYTQLFSVGSHWRQAVIQMVGALVPMVPEGLVLITSVAFALGVIRLGQRMCLVQELPAIEGLARVDVVCADKTGTLTEAGMTLAEVRPLAGISESQLPQLLAQIAGADPSPNASIAAIAQAMPLTDSPWQVTARAPFTSAKKWSGVSFSTANYVLGAPDVLAAPNSPAGQQAAQIGATGMRVLLLASSDTQVDAAGAPGTLTPVALVVLGQKIRPDAAPTLDFFRSQAVNVKVISGDNAASVAAITADVGVAGQAVDARTLDVAAPDFADRVDEGAVFGRVTPEQKRAMVTALQSRGHTVAMTGDGVNDVLALKDADIGVAMGSGSAATRSVAQIVLLDNKFATLPYVVAEGRRVIGNIERVANLFLTKTIYSVLLALLVVFAQVPFPFQPVHVTITGWFTIGIPAFLMSLAPNNEKARPGFVPRVLRLAIPMGVIVGSAAFVTYMMLIGTHTRDESATAALATLIVGSTWVLAVVARPYQWWRIALVVVSLAAYALIFALPATQNLFFLAPQAGTMVLGLAVGLIAAVIVEATWWITGKVTGQQLRLWVPKGS